MQNQRLKITYRHLYLADPELGRHHVLMYVCHVVSCHAVFPELSLDD